MYIKFSTKNFNNDNSIAIVMSRTNRRKTHWFRHENPKIRQYHFRSHRHKNKILLKKGWEIEPYFKTRGWLTW
jgi:hypothetical protein